MSWIYIVSGVLVVGDPDLPGRGAAVSGEILMSGNSYLQLAFYVVVLIGLAKPLGAYMARVYEGRPSLLSRIGGPVERGIYRACGIDASKETNWVGYTIALLMFNLVGGLVVYGLQRLQASLPLNPAGMGAVSPDSSFNTAISFMTNTNWQGYGGESTMSYLSQMAGLGVQNFVSAATGIAVVIALTRGSRAPERFDDRQLLGRHDAQRALHPAAAVVRPRAGAGFAGRRADVLRISDRVDGGIGRIREGATRRRRSAAEGCSG